MEEIRQYRLFRRADKWFSTNTIRGALVGHWRHYRSVCAARGYRPGIGAFAVYLARCYEHVWGNRTLGHTLLEAPRRVVRRLMHVQPRPVVYDLGALAPSRRLESRR